MSGRLAVLEGVVNDHKDLELTIKNIPVGQTLDKAWFTVQDEQKVELLSISITDVLTASGQITDTGADGTGVIVFLLTPTNTTLFGTAIRYYDVQVKLNPSAKVTTVEQGEVRFCIGRTADTS